MESRPTTHQVTGAALSRHPAHAARPSIGTSTVVAIVAGVAVSLGALVVGTAVLLRSSGPATSAPTSAQFITVTGEVPLRRP